MRTLDELRAQRTPLRPEPAPADPVPAEVDAALEVADALDGIGTAAAFPADVEWALRVLGVAARGMLRELDERRASVTTGGPPPAFTHEWRGVDLEPPDSATTGPRSPGDGVHASNRKRRS